MNSRSTNGSTHRPSPLHASPPRRAPSRYLTLVLLLTTGCPGSDAPRPDAALGDGNGDIHVEQGASCQPGGCVDDQRCVDGHCKAWGDGAFDAFDPTCTLPAEPFTVTPRVLCHWPPAGVPMTEGPEAWRWARRVASTIVAATFLPAPSELAQPPTWLVFATGSVLSSSNDPAPPGTWQAGGVLRVLDPQSCTLIDTLDEVPVAAWFQPPAIGDLDGDKVPEIVAQAWDEQVPGAPNYQSSGRLVAWKYDPASKRFRVWRQSTVAGQPEADLVFSAAYQQMSGPTIADLDNDGKPEVVLAGRVYDSELRRLTGAPS